MTDTTEITITKEWQKVANGVCEIQSVNDRRTYNKIFFNLIVSDTPPTSDSTAFMRITLNEHANFHRPTPVWLRLDEQEKSNAEPIVIIKDAEL